MDRKPLLSALMVLAACSSATAPNDDSHATTSQVADSGVSSSPEANAPAVGGGGAAECFEDGDCDDSLRSALAALIGPPYPRDYSEARCVRARLSSGGSSWGGTDGEPSCSCGPESAHALLSSTAPYECLFYGRVARCLYRTDEFPGCDLNQADSCTEICADLQARVMEDAQREITGQVRLARCDEYHCRGVLEVEGACYAATPLLPQPEPCSKSDEDILNAQAEREAASRDIPSCDEVPRDAGVTTCTTPAPSQDCYFPRDPGEWEGAPVNICNQIPCEATCDDLGCGGFCGVRLACIDGKCTACTRDADCLTGEACVLDQCVPAEQVECRTRHDCDPDILCTLIDEPGAPSEPRGNQATWSICTTQERLNMFLAEHGGGPGQR